MKGSSGVLVGFALTLVSGMGCLPASSTATPSLPTATSTVGSGPAAVTFVGRFDNTDPSKPRFTWSGSTILARFTGGSLSVRFYTTSSWGDLRFSATVDGGTPVILTVLDDGTSTGGRTYPIVTGLGPGDHDVKLVRDTEGSYGISQFLGFDFGTGGGLLPAAPRPSRRIEIIGDSLSCGYGNLGTDYGDPALGPTCSFSTATESNSLAYGTLAAIDLGAEQTTIAYSGKGIFRNDPGVASSPVMPHDYLYAITPKNYDPIDPAFNDEGKFLFDFSSQPRPDVVVVNLGRNDFASGQPAEADFAKAYKDFLGVVRSKSPSAHIFCAAPIPLASDPAGSDMAVLRSYVTNIVSSFGASDKIHLVEYAEPNDLPTGCDGHPNTARHRIMAGELEAAIRPVMGW